MQIILDKKCFQVNGWNQTELVKDIFDFGYTLLGRLIWSLKIQLHSSQKFKYLKNNSCAVGLSLIADFFSPRLATSVSSRAVFSPILISIINFLLLTTYLFFLFGFGSIIFGPKQKKNPFKFWLRLTGKPSEPSEPYLKIFDF